MNYYRFFLHPKRRWGNIGITAASIFFCIAIVRGMYVEGITVFSISALIFTIVICISNFLLNYINWKNYLSQR